ncbi:tyrosine-type recombinase/integrase [Burkholderia multivorans]|uniref:tyrosine-type recombinase/integrase n=1 Tax=Burkholderia multivorans TaxID=87883 RepID=UPI00158DB337|nr:site-specific integrase [Burkholderia multivorans]MDN7950414.1 integrase arm-type DNA-binding domain-containing protein [Burkholderia multivorans]MDR9238363.1 Prophage integrase IntA [Burkholderia multivorans]MDR9270953.1 Prophage integrase IntA [Burkholderia multivorans]MDR9288445.1 Prophage integrase IntA [Burkholderia multivorans]MDR9293063.1 Prophage integrase IntA [Burkholderia multivorans]
MPRKATELGALAVSKLSKPGKHAVGRVAGLVLQISPTGAKSWLLRVTVGGRRREIGLGAYPAVSLKEAHAKAQATRDEIAAGIDPVLARKEAASRLRASQAYEITFEEAAKRFIKAKAPEWKNAKHGDQWRNTLAEYAYPKLGSLMVRHVARPHVMEVLEPIWTTKTETASRLRGRIEAILDWAKVKGFRDDGTNPASWRGNLDKLLPAPKRTKRVRNHPALPINQMGAFMEALRGTDGVSARCLEFAILTAARSGEARGARWSEIDMRRGIWSIPAERMKAKKEHRVPLSPAAIELLKAIKRTEDQDLVFPSPRSGSVLSDMALLEVMRRQSIEATPHGFRSTFRDWAGEYTNYPRELAEVALAHIKADATEAAYWRGDVLEKRRQMMSDWATFIELPTTPGEILPMRRTA